MADFYEVLNPDGTTELVPVESGPLQSAEEARSWWQFSPTDTPAIALEKFGAAGLQGLPFGEEIAARTDVLGAKLGELLGGSPAPIDVATQQQGYREMAKAAEKEAYGKALLSQIAANVPSIGAGIGGAVAKKAGAGIPAVGEAIMSSPYISSILGGSVTGAGLAEPEPGSSTFEAIQQRLPSAAGGALIGGAVPAVTNTVLALGGWAAKTRPVQALIEGGQDIAAPVIQALRGAAPETIEQAREAARRQMGAVGNLPASESGKLTIMERATAQQLARRGFDPEAALKAQQEAVAGGRPEQLLFESEYFPTQKTGALDLADILAQRPSGAPIASEALMSRIGKKGFEGEQEVMRGRVTSILDKLSPEKQFEVGASQGYKTLESFRDAVNKETAEKGSKLYEGMFKGEPSERLIQLLDEPDAQKFFEKRLTPAFPGERYSQEAAKEFVSDLKYIERNTNPNIPLSPTDRKNATRLRKAIETELETLNPGYKAADAAYRSLRQQVSGLSEAEMALVENTLRSAPDKVGATLVSGKTSPQFVENISEAIGNKLGRKGKEGLAAALRVELERKGGEKGGTELVKAIRRGPATNRKIGALVGKETAQLIKEGLDQEVQMLESAGKILRGSRTGVRAVNDQELTTVTQSLFNVVTTFPSKMGQLFSDAVKGQLGLTDAAVEEMAKIIYSSGPEAAQNISKLKPYINRIIKNKQGVDTLVDILKPQSTLVSRVTSRAATEE